MDSSRTFLRDFVLFTRNDCRNIASNAYDVHFSQLLKGFFSETTDSIPLIYGLIRRLLYVNSFQWSRFLGLFSYFKMKDQRVPQTHMISISIIFRKVFSKLLIQLLSSRA